MDTIPDEHAWGDWRADFDQQWAHDELFGLSSVEAQKKFAESNPVNVGNWLRFIAPPVFQYYLKAFALYVTSLKGSRSSDAPDAASVFLHLIRGKLHEKPMDILPALKDVLPTVILVSQAQLDFNASADIYGDFDNMGRDIIAVARNLGMDGSS
jgi:hypothetical protein